MKKEKIMLTAMIILGTVGGVLAFKAKRNTLFCTAPVPASGSCTSQPQKCTAGTILKIDVIGADRCYKLTNNTSNCLQDNQFCVGRVRLTANP